MSNDDICVICRAATEDSALCDPCESDLEQCDYAKYSCHNCSRTVTVLVEDLGALLEFCADCWENPSAPPYALMDEPFDGRVGCDIINCNNTLVFGTSRLIDKNICDECWGHRYDDAYYDSKGRVCGLCKKRYLFDSGCTCSLWKYINSLPPLHLPWSSLRMFDPSESEEDELPF